MVQARRRQRRGATGKELTRFCCQGAAGLLEELGVRITIEGAEHFLAHERPMVFASNHMSMFDPLVIYGAVGPHRSFVSVTSRYLSKMPVCGPLFSSLPHIWVDRKSPRRDLQAVYAEGVAHLRAGRSVLVFPESTRLPRFSPGRFNSMAVKLARRAGVPVCPVAVQTDAWSVGWPFRLFGRIHPAREIRVTFGPPVEVEPNDLPQRARLIHFIARQHETWGRPLDLTPPLPWWLHIHAPTDGDRATGLR